MRQSQLIEHGNVKNGNGLCSTPLKISKDSHLIKKSSSSPSPSSSTSSSTMTAVKPPQHRQPVIIYTHSPKIIHTNPRDFMALVQKLTGLSRSDDGVAAQQGQRKAEKSDVSEDHQKKVKDAVEPSSVISEENRCRGSAANIVGDGNSSCFLPTIFENSPAYLGNFPLFPNPNDFFGPNHSFFNFSDSMFFAPGISSSVSTFDEFRDF